MEGAGRNPPSAIKLFDANDVSNAVSSITKNTPIFVDVYDVVRPALAPEEAAKLSRPVYAMTMAASKSVFIRTQLSVVLMALLKQVGANRARVIKGGHIAMYRDKSTSPKALLPVGLVKKHLLPILDSVVTHLRGLPHSEFKKYDDKQTSIQDISLIATSIYAASKSFTTNMAYAFKVGAFCNLQDAVYSLMHMETLPSGIAADITFSDDADSMKGKKARLRGRAFGKAMVTDFSMPTSLKVVSVARDFDDDDEDVFSSTVDLSQFTRAAPQKEQPLEVKIAKLESDLRAVAARSVDLESIKARMIKRPDPSPSTSTAATASTGAASEQSTSFLSGTVPQVSLFELDDNDDEELGETSPTA